MGPSLPVPLPAAGSAPAVPRFQIMCPNGAWYQPPAPRAAAGGAAIGLAWNPATSQPPSGT